MLKSFKSYFLNGFVKPSVGSMTQGSSQQSRRRISGNDPFEYFTTTSPHPRGRASTYSQNFFNWTNQRHTTELAAILCMLALAHCRVGSRSNTLGSWRIQRFTAQS